MMRQVIRQTYGLAMEAASPLLRRKLRRRAGEEPLYGQFVEERFGQYEQAPSQGMVWVHAVSLGETRAAAVLLAALRARLPGMRLLLTHGTATGRAEGAALLREGDVQVWQPWDTTEAVGRFLAHFKPRLGVLMETEVWPNLVHGCRRAGVPLVLANARMSRMSLDKALRMRWLARPAFSALTVALAQTEADARRLRELGAPVRGVFGNLKYDAAPDARQVEQGRGWRAARAASATQAAQPPVLMLASSREGEEQAFLDALGPAPGASGVAHAQRGMQPGTQPGTPPRMQHGVQPMIVPRHPQRFAEVADLAAARGWQVVRRTGWAGVPPASAPGTLWLGDSLGEMALYYSLADAALLGGSFEPLGGQNLIEAAACGCPVVMGPHTFNFSEAAELALAAGAAWRVADMREAVTQATALCADTARTDAAHRAALDFAAAHRGAAERTVGMLMELLDDVTPGADAVRLSTSQQAFDGQDPQAGQANTAD